MTSWYTAMQMEEQKPTQRKGKAKTKKVVVMVTPTSAENARQKQLANKKKT